MSKNHKKNPIKNFLFLVGLFVVLVGVFLPIITFSAMNPEEACRAISGTWNGKECVGGLGAGKGTSAIGWVAAEFFKAIGQFLMLIGSTTLIIAGLIFDTVIDFTIINMAQNIGDPNGIGGAITGAWGTLRDIANMCFIFVLLFAAFKAMFSLSFSSIGTTIKNIIIVALLINFSLFFSKVVIDASNIVSVGFYESIATANNNTKLTGNSTFGSTANFKGISGGYMRMLGLQTFYGAEILDSVAGEPLKILLLGIMTSVFMLLSALIFFMAAVMFIARFIILIFLMILSPLALIAYIIPGIQGKFNEWKSALMSQSFFAPLYFALTWVVFKLGNSFTTVLKEAGGTGSVGWTGVATNPQSVMYLVFNYFLLMGFSVAALILSKQMATSGATGSAFKAISGGIGTAAIGGAALVGRNTIGRASSLVSEKYRDKWSQSTAGRAGLWLANKGKQSSFDVRALGDTKLIKSIGADKYTNEILGTAGKARGKGGYTKAVEDKAKEKAKYAKDVYGKTDREKELEKELKEKYEKNKKNFDTAVKQEEESVKKAEKNAAEEKKRAEEDLKAKKEAEKNVDKLNPFAMDAAKKATAEAERVLAEKERAHNEAITKRKSVLDDKNYSEATKALEKLAEQDKKAWEDIQNASANRLEAYAKRLEKLDNIKGTVIGTVSGGVLGGVGGIYGATMGAGIGAGLGRGGKESARAARKMIKGKTDEELIVEAAERIAKKKKEESGEETEKAKEEETPQEKKP